MVRRNLILGLAVLVTVSACAAAPRRPGRAAPLSRDSAAVLERAIRQARPAFPTQRDALRLGAYAMSVGGGAPAPERTATAPVSQGAVRFVVQIAAFRDRPSAELLAGRARSLFIDLRIVVESDGGLFRVALGEWSTEPEAQQALSRVRLTFPTAWVRRSSVP